MIAFMAEPQILLTVVAGTVAGMPAPSAAWRAGPWPRPAGSTQPMITSWTSPGDRPLPCKAPRMAAVPSSTAVTPANTPWKAPIGVRLAATMTMESFSGMFLRPLCGVRPVRPGHRTAFCPAK